MADKPDDKAKRQVKNPDTFRERAVKASETSNMPSRSKKVRSAIASPFRPVGRVIGGTSVWKAVKTVISAIFKVLRFLIPPYLRNSFKELKLVTWPSWKQSRQLTYAVLVFAVVFGASIALVDFGLDKLFKNILLK